MGRGAVIRHGERKGDFLAGKYLLEDCLGVGGMGEVYRATNVSLGRKVAIKLLSPEYVHIEDDVLRFLREARAAAAVRHPNVVDVLDVARDDDGTPFIVQELLSGEDLEHYLRARNGRLSFEEALEIMIPVADAVAAAHGHDVVHRDLKPANIFLARDRNKITPKVLDFGACLFPTIAERSAKEVRMLIGTPHYMAPEQIVSKQDVDSRSDVWALGIILYEMIVGETPFEAETVNAVLQLVKTQDVPPLGALVRNAPSEVEALIARCTKRDRLSRYRDAGALHSDLVAARQNMRGAPASSRAQTLLERSDEADLEPPSKRAPAPPPQEFEIPSLDEPTGAAPPRARNAQRLLTLNSPTSEPPASGDFGLDVSIQMPSDKGARRSPPASDEISISPVRQNDSTAGRQLENDEPDERSPLALAAQPSSWPPHRQQNNAPSSIPPVLDPRAFGSVPTPPPPAAIPREALLEESTPLSQPIGPISSPKPRPPVVSAHDMSAVRRPTWSTAEKVKLGAIVAVPALIGFLVVLLVPVIGGHVGGALRGDSTIESGVMAVTALVGAAVLCARSILGEKKSRALYVASGGSVLFGIVMIIVTFAASEAAELGVPQSMAGLSTVVAPIAPLVLAIRSIREAREGWIDPYSRGDAVRLAAFASAMVFLALALSPVGAARVAPRAQPHRTAASPG